MGKRLNSVIRSRIVGHEDVAPDQLLAHESNFRRHPGEQLDALRGSMTELGWVKSVLVSKRTGKVIDGHARIEEAMRQGLAAVPVEYVDLSPEEEKLALAVLDPITEMAKQDDEALAALLAEVGPEDEALREMLAGMETEPADKVQVQEVDVSDVQDRFWMSVRGPLPRQVEALERLKTMLEELTGVEVELGSTEG